MKTPGDKFCVLPWVSIEASPIGTIRPCCLADDEIVGEEDRKLDLNTDSLDDARNGWYMTWLRQQFLKGEQPRTCRKCWREEDAGRTSKRMHTLNRLKHIVTDEEWTEEAKDLVFLDLKLGNICNLKCRICGSWSSSQFAAEELKERPNDEVHRMFLKQGAWPRTTDVFWDELKHLSGGLRYLEFTGGEPFMIKEHFQFLQYLVNEGYAPNIEIHYNTNGTQWPAEYISLWTKFKLVEIAFSIDNIGSRFEYERTNARWDEVNHNIENYMALRASNKNIQLQLCCTINIYNVLYLESVYHWKYFKKFDFVYWNMLHDEAANCIQALPQRAKEAIAERLRNANVDDATRKEFDQAIEFMMMPNMAFPEDVRATIERLDSRRGHSLRSTHPELYRLIYDQE